MDGSGPFGNPRAQAPLNLPHNEGYKKDCLQCRLTGAAVFGGAGLYSLYEARKHGAFDRLSGTGKGAEGKATIEGLSRGVSGKGGLRGTGLAVFGIGKFSFKIMVIKFFKDFNYRYDLSWLIPFTC